MLTPNHPTSPILFAYTPNDDLNTEGGFDVYRVIGSAINWTAGTNNNIEWYLYADGYAPETVAYTALHRTALEQTRSMVSSIRSKVAGDRLCGSCGSSKTKIQHYAWVNPVYYNTKSKNPVDVDGDIWGFEAGIDVFRNDYHRIGGFVSYRQGEYDLNGKGRVIYSNIGSSIDTKSYIGGLYYQYDNDKQWLFATLYGGTQRSDIKTNDGVRSNTEGSQFGFSIDGGYSFDAGNGWVLEPGVGAAYTQINFDDASDNYGKTASYDTLSQFLMSASVKIQKNICLDSGEAHFYFKPGILKTFTHGDTVSISGINNVKTYGDSLLGQVEVGAKYAITNSLSTYGYANYTFGDHYKLTSLGIGLSWSF